MRFLADENFPRAAVEALAATGHDVVSIAAVHPGASDAEVLIRAVREQRILLTFDKDFGELALRSQMPAGSGIVSGLGYRGWFATATTGRVISR